MEYAPKEWVTELYNETKQEWKKYGEDPKGFAIFYSPVKIKPTIALIGINPGGNEKDFKEQDCNIQPTENEYLTANYPMAEKIKKIFNDGNLWWALEDSVKFNLYFFRSKKIKDINNNKEMKKFCEDKVLKILDKIKPKYIVAEAFETYNRLKELLEAKEEREVKEGGRAILCIAKTNGNIPLLGMIHPTGGYGISDDILAKIGLELEKIIEK